jgi:hypothetical protein
MVKKFMVCAAQITATYLGRKMCFFWKIIILALNGRKSPKIVIITPLAF